MRLILLILLAILVNGLFAQNFKLTNFTISAGQSFVRDPYRSFDYFKGYATDPSSLDADSINFYQSSDIVPSPKSIHQTVWYNGKNLGLSIGFKPKKEHREVNFGLQYSSVKQSSYQGSRHRSLPWDTLTSENNSNEVDTLYSYFVAADYKNFELSTKNLFVSTEYLFKSKSTCVQYFVGIGCKVGASISQTIIDRGNSSISQVLFNPSRNERFVNYSPLNYPTWFFEQPEMNIQRESYGSKTIFYCSPYLPFGMRIPLDQTIKVLSNFSLDLRGNIGLEVQMMRQNTLMIRQVISGNIGLTYRLQ